MQVITEQKNIIQKRINKLFKNNQIINSRHCKKNLEESRVNKHKKDERDLRNMQIDSINKTVSQLKILTALKILLTKNLFH